MSRAVFAGLVLVALLALAGCGGGDEGASDKRPASDPFTEVSREPSLTRTARRAAPRWERVDRFEGIAPAVHEVKIAQGAIQWRARWRCEPGAFALVVSPAPRSGSARAGGDCPGRGERSWVTSGRQQLRVEASGDWRVSVEQEVDTALHEPPLAAMRAPAARVVARGDFYKIDRKGGGRASLYRLAGGRLALRMENFVTEPNTDLFVWLSEAKRPRTTRAAFGAPHVEVAGLKSTLGDQNYVLPKGLDTAKIRSIVIWCEPVQNAYTAATLSR